MLAASRTDIGRSRSQNQDAVFCSLEPVGPLPNLFIVADGMGGHNAGEVASRQAVSLFREYAGASGYDGKHGYLDLMVSAAAEVNRAVFNLSLNDPALEGMGTTFTACVISNGKCEIVHIGDSRAYMFTKKRAQQLTADHSFVNEMVKAGQLTQAQAREHPRRNVLTRVMGVDPDMSADGYVRMLEKGCVLLLCSDGLTNMLTDEFIHTAAVAETPLDERIDGIIGMANAEGGHDNISVIIVDTRMKV